MAFATMYHQAATSYLSNMDAIKRQISDVKSENANYQQRLATTSEELTRHKKAQKKLRKEIDTLSAEKIATQNTLNETQKSLKISNGENVQSCELICRLEGQVKKYQENVFDLHKQIDSFEYELKHLEMNLHESTQERKSTNERFAATEKTLKEKTEELQNLKLQCEKETAERKQSAHKLHQQVEHLTNEKNELAVKLHAHEEKMKELETELTNTSTKNCKLRVSKKKFKALAERLQEQNATNEKKLEEMSSLASSLKITEDKNALLDDHLTRLKEELKERLLVTESIKEQVRQLKKHNSELEHRLHQLSESYDALKKEKDSKEQTIKSIQDEQKESKASHERAVYKLKATKRGIEQDLEMSRCELKERRKDVSVLKQENLEKDFKIQELTRSAKENKSLLQLKEKEEQHWKDCCQQLTTEVAVLKEKHRTRDHKKQKRKQEQKEGQTLLERLQEIKTKRDEKQKYDEQFSESTLAIAELERRLKDSESSLRAEQMEKSILHEEMQRMRLINISKLKGGEKTNLSPLK